MRTRYDREVDALSIELRAKAKSARTVRVGDDVAVDFDAEGRAVAIEILNASHHLGRAGVDRLPPASELLSLAEAGARSGLSPETLRGQIHKGKLKGEKRGRDWVVDATSLENYLEAVEARRERTPAPVKRKRRAKA